MVLKLNFKISNALLRFEIRFHNHETLLMALKFSFTTMAKN